MKVRDILTNKGNTVYSVPPSVTVYDALKLMADKNLGALLVINEGELVGIFTERDYARKVILKGKSSKEIVVEEIMHPDPITVTEDSGIDECMDLMTNKFVRHLPVMKDEEIAGIISIGDVVKYIISEQQFIIENLGNYITGSKGSV